LGDPPTAILTITNDDAPPPHGVLQFAPASQNIFEGDAGITSATLTISRTLGSTGAVSAYWATAAFDGTALPIIDYLGSSGTLNWADGETGDKTITMTIYGDNVIEPDDTVLITMFNLTYSEAVGATTSTLTLLNDDVASGGGIGSGGGCRQVVADVGVPAQRAPAWFTARA
jgi:hypothetical protein